MADALADHSVSDVSRDLRIRSIAQREAGLEGEIRGARENVAPLRHHHADRVAAALATPIARWKAAAWRAIADLEAAVAALNEGQAEIRIAGGDAPPLRINLDTVKAALGPAPGRGGRIIGTLGAATAPSHIRTIFF